MERNYPNLKQVTCRHIYNFNCVNNKSRWEDLHDGKSLQLDKNLLKNSQGIHNLNLEYTKTQDNTDISWHKRTIASSSYMAQNKTFVWSWKVIMISYLFLQTFCLFDKLKTLTLYLVQTFQWLILPPSSCYRFGKCTALKLKKNKVVERCLHFLSCVWHHITVIHVLPNTRVSNRTFFLIITNVIQHVFVPAI